MATTTIKAAQLERDALPILAALVTQLAMTAITGAAMVVAPLPGRLTALVWRPR